MFQNTHRPILVVFNLEKTLLFKIATFKERKVAIASDVLPIMPDMALLHDQGKIYLRPGLKQLVETTVRKFHVGTWSQFLPDTNEHVVKKIFKERYKNLAFQLDLTDCQFNKFSVSVHGSITKNPNVIWRLQNTLQDLNNKTIETQNKFCMLDSNVTSLPPTKKSNIYKSSNSIVKPSTLVVKPSMYEYLTFNSVSNIQNTQHKLDWSIFNTVFIDGSTRNVHTFGDNLVHLPKFSVFNLDFPIEYDITLFALKKYLCRMYDDNPSDVRVWIRENPLYKYDIVSRSVSHDSLNADFFPFKDIKRYRAMIDSIENEQEPEVGYVNEL